MGRGWSSQGNRLTLWSDRHGHAEPSLQQKVRPCPAHSAPAPLARLSPTHRHVRPAPCVPCFGDGVHELPANAEVTEFNISISVQKNIGRFDVCKGRKFKPVSQGCRFPFQQQQLQRLDVGSTVRSPSRLDALAAATEDPGWEQEEMEPALKTPHA